MPDGILGAMQRIPLACPSLEQQQERCQAFERINVSRTACRCSCQRSWAFWQLKLKCGFENTPRGSLCGPVCASRRGYSPPRVSHFFCSYMQGFVLLILLECGSYHHLEEFIALPPSLLPRLRRRRNKRAIVWFAEPWIQVCWHWATLYLIFPIIKKEGEKLIMLPSPREWKEKGLRERRLGPPAIKSSYFKAKD